MRTLIFDFGNVIGFFDHYRTLAKLTPHSDMPAEAMFEAIYHGDIEDRFESNQLTRAQFFDEVRTACRLALDDAHLAPAFQDIFTPNPEVCELLPRLKKHYRLLLGSNTNELHASHFLESFDAHLGLFDHLVLSFRIGVRKPKRGFFENCILNAQAKAEECLFIDDLAANIAGAEAVGMKGLVYAPGQDLAGQLQSLGVRV